MSTGLATAPPAAALELFEAAAARPSALDADGTCLIHIIRPGRGLGRGSHFYPASMLRENAHVFTGWNVYVDHEAPEAQKARGGLPRSMHDLGGLIEESWWDDSLPAEGRFGQGGVVGRLRPIRDLKTVIAELPEAARFSIKARATDVTEGLEEGFRVWVVEGIRQDPPGSVDAVTLDGAGGKVAALLEAQQCDEQWLQEAELAEARARAEEHKHNEPAEGEGGKTVPKELEEALRDPESAISVAVQEAAKEAAKPLVEAAVQEARAEMRDEIRDEVREELRDEFKTELAEARADERAAADRTKQLVSLRQTAHTLIEEAELGEKFTAKLKRQFDLEESGEPTDALDVVDRLDSDGNVEKSAKDLLTEAVEAEITDAREVLAEANPTRVEGQGGGESPPSGGGDGGSQPTAQRSQGEKRFWQEHLEESGVNPAEAFPDRTDLVEAGSGKE